MYFPKFRQNRLADFFSIVRVVLLYIKECYPRCVYQNYSRSMIKECFFCTHTNTDVYTYSRYIVPLALYSNLMMAS